MRKGRGDLEGVAPAVDIEKVFEREKHLERSSGSPR